MNSSITNVTSFPSIIESEHSLLDQSSRSIESITKKELGVVLSIFVLANGLFFGAPAIAKALYRDRIMPFVQIDGLSVGGKTFSQASALVASNNSLRNSKVTLTYKDQSQEVFWSQLGVQEDIRSELNAAYSIGRTQSYFPPAVARQYQIDQAILEKSIIGYFGKHIVDPRNAQLALNGTTVTITPEVKGSQFIWGSIRDDIVLSIAGRNKSIELVTKEVLPSIRRTDLDPLKTKIENLLESPISLTIGLEKITIAQDMIAQWITVDQEKLPASVKINDEALRNYVDRLAKQYDTKSKPEIKLDDGSVEQQGVAGRQMDKEKVMSAIKEVLINGSKESIVELAFHEIPFTKKIKSSGFTAGLYEGKYIEINLSEQRMYTFEGSNLVGTFPVSTGKWSMPTPEGEFSINNKVEVAYSATYKLYMPHWMAFIGSKYGIHGLPYWANGYVEGEDHLGKPVSHGCIRLSHADADTVYNWADVGTKVYIHK